MLRFTTITLLIASLFFTCAQKPTEKGIRWMTLGEVETVWNANPRPVLIDLYTDWCGWCKVMDKRTYANGKVAAYLQDKFYPIKLNAETRDAVKWMGKEYAFNKGYNTNEIALYLTRGQLSYPTTVIIPAPGEEPQAIPGFLNPSEIEPILKYFGEGAYKTMAFPDYHKKFKGAW
ncbi:DUF255 domain-containing protein [Flavihumibacter rivuli]|uniref:thioredoxin family protein n=1 Tax=Flavihumibacter rivuli TaxID=2838156 RepID=UPI001BDED38E|nr:DUF255 domain-containing protein [Flavihumibacter rivuli]ULQ56740.1 DUF255 domain-containing protein [Flavihumibacter rivuli]